MNGCGWYIAVAEKYSDQIYDKIDCERTTFSVSVHPNVEVLIVLLTHWAFPGPIFEKFSKNLILFPGIFKKFHEIVFAKIGPALGS